MLKKRNQLFYLESNTPKVIRDLASKLMIPEFKKITNHLNDAKIAITSNKIENCFLKNFPKHIKIIQNRKNGILKKSDLKLRYWNEDNAIF